MKNNAGKKVRNIIMKEFDMRMSMAVITYILDKGFENLKEVTEEEILKVKGNAFMSDKFCQSLVRCAVKICKECNQIDDFLPFIVNHLIVPKASTKEIEISKSHVDIDLWEIMIRQFDLEEEDEDEELDMIVLNANVIETVKFD